MAILKKRGEILSIYIYQWLSNDFPTITQYTIIFPLFYHYFAAILLGFPHYYQMIPLIKSLDQNRSRLKVQLGLHGPCQARQLPAAQDALVLQV